jgi:S1-C subfamily serine protease
VAEARGVYIVSRREFAGSWEYLLDNAIFTAPPHANFAGAALLGADGRLLGIGSLFVGDAAGANRPLPGNMFVPIDELKPIFASLVGNGRRPGAARPWLGLYPAEIGGHVFVDRLAEDGPAARAGLERGDLIVAVGDTPVDAVAGFFRALWSSGVAGDTITLRVLRRGGAVREVPVTSIDRMQWLRLDQSL